MTVKTIELVRKIRDKQYAQTKSLSTQEQLEYIKKKSEKLSREFHGYRHPAMDNAK